MEVQFSSPVDISFVDVDDASNFDRKIWVTGTSGNFDYSSGLSGAINGLSVINSPDNATDGAFRHVFSPITGITTLLIGSAPTFNLGAIEGQTRGSQFFITGLGFEISDTRDGGPVISVPEPASILLIGLGGLAMLFFRRRRQA